VGGLRGAVVVFVNNFPGPSLGGGEVHLLHLVRGCVAAGMDVRVVCEPGSRVGDEAREAGATVVRMPLTGPDLPGTARRVRKYLRESGADIVHAGGWLTNAAVRLAGRGLPLAVVNTVHCEPAASLADGGSRLGLAARRVVDHATRSRADLVLPITRAVGDSLVAEGWDPSRMHVIPNGVDVASVTKAASAPLPAGLSLPDGDGPLVGVVARLEPVKGVDVFIRAAMLVAAHSPHVRFVVVGGGSAEAELRSLASSLDPGRRIALVGPVAGALPLLARFDVAVVPSRSEGLPTSLLEALALGVPVVASAVGGIPDVVTDGETGVLVPPDDPAALADAIVSLLEGPAAALGSAGASLVAQRYSVSGMVEQHLALYEVLIGRRHRE